MRTLMCVMCSGLLLVLVGCADKKGSSTGPAGTGPAGTGPAGSKLEAAKDKPQDLIVGKWQPADEKTIIEFTKDGGMIVWAEEKEVAKGKYKFDDDTTLVTEMILPPDAPKDTPNAPKKVKVLKLTKDEFVSKEEGKDKETTMKKK